MDNICTSDKDWLHYIELLIYSMSMLSDLYKMTLSDLYLKVIFLLRIYVAYDQYLFKICNLQYF
jgi:hypothetical protein